MSDTKKRPRKKSGSGSESETGSVSDTDEEDASAVHSEQLISNLTVIEVISRVACVLVFLH